MKRNSSVITATFGLVACTLFLWMFFAAATLERTADLGGISASVGEDARAAAYEFAASWRHGMAGNSPIYMPGFFAAAIAMWFWCDGKNLSRMLVEGGLLMTVAALSATMLAPLAAPKILKSFVAQKEFSVSRAASSGSWVAFAQGVYSLLTWSTVIIASRLSIRMRSFKPLLVPLLLNLLLALLRPWTVADFTSRWVSQALAGDTVAVISMMLVPLISGFLAWTELRSRRRISTAE